MNLPKLVDIIEVGPRDGFQNVQQFINTDTKVEVIEKLIESNLKKIEIASFVHPKWMPQMVDAIEVIARVKDYAQERDVELIALIPNLTGFLKAKNSGVHSLTYTISCSETHNMKNLNRTIEQSLAELEKIMMDIGSLKLRLAISASFGCPFGEIIPEGRLAHIINVAEKLGVDKVLLADTTGTGSPLKVKEVIQGAKENIALDKLGVHIHNSKGMGLAGTLVALQEGISYFESSIAGLGGCPFAPGAAGNVATEDLVNMLHLMGIETKVELDRLLETVKVIKEKVNAPISSHMASFCGV